uniref:Dishevelled binding antagonist of beta catenin 1 n=1 Tax=Oryzias latipes TaxID=8090 RepID=A0A3P9JRW1_ORYLA
MPQRAPVAAEEMPLSSACRRDSHRAGAAERLRSVRERLDAVVFGLSELESMRQRQQVLIRTALEKPGDREAQLSPEENILVLRRQLSLLRRGEAVLMGPLQELDLHINQLRLDGQTPSDQVDVDSRPSSGFYELSDGTSGSLSTSSHSVFSECLYSMTDTDGAPTDASRGGSCCEPQPELSSGPRSDCRFCLSPEELADCEEFVQGLSDASSSSGVVCPSISSAHLPPSEAASSDVSTNSCSDPPAPNSNLIFRYPSPLRTNATQSPAFLQCGGRGRDENGADGLKAEMYPAFKSSSLKHLDGYIYSLLQRRTQPIRTSRPRTSISTDPTKSVLRQSSFCAKQVSGFEILKGSDEKPGRSAEGISRSSPPKSQSEEQDDGNTTNKNNCRSSASPRIHIFKTTNSLKTKQSKGSLSHSGLLNGSKELGGSPLNSSLAGGIQPFRSTDQELLLRSPPSVKTKSGSIKNLSKSVKKSRKKDAEGPAPERSFIMDSTPTSKQGPKEGGKRHKVFSTSSHHLSAKLCKVGSKNVKSAKVKTSLMSETSVLQSERRQEKSRHRSSSGRLQCLGDGSSAHTEAQSKSVLASSLEDQDKHTPLAPFRTQAAVLSHRHRGNRHRRSRQVHDQVNVVGKPKHNRPNYRRLHSGSENHHCTAKRHGGQLQREEGQSTSKCPAHQSGPCSRAAESDSEYSAECVSLFHSTIADTSEDENSDYTANRFGDSECSGGEAEESTTDTEEGAGALGGRSRRLVHFEAAGVGGQAQMKTLVRVKASYKLKKKILRFRSGSLKLMTTM